MNRFTALSVAAVLSLAAVTSAIAAEPVNTLEKGLFGYKSGEIAIRGYDTVAYFTDGMPVEGTDDFTTEWNGAIWRFASREHLDLFAADPEKYAPRYGGYCAYGVARDGLVKIEPENWSIVDGKLYLNYDDDVQALWQADVPGFIAEADAKFDDLVAE